jgi:LuxR family maltose regulon positive regulatory protein
MIDTQAFPLVFTKLRGPTMRPRLVHRAPLLERLTPQTGTGLLLVCAPAGYGKSTLLAEWAQVLQQNGAAVAWYALDPSDDDPIAFGSYLVASLAQALGPTSELAHIAQLLRSSPEVDLQRILPAVINAVVAIDRTCVLILDDYHLISVPAIHAGIAFLLEHLPEKMCIAIGSRSDPPLPLARLRAHGHLLEIRVADLRFTADETTRFLNDAMQLNLAPELVKALEARTEGWVAGLQLAALSLSGRSDKESFISSFTGSHRYLVEYLLEEVVSRQSDEVQSFLLATSILERLCAPLCDALIENSGWRIENNQGHSNSLSPTSASQTILEYLEHANLFLIALDDQGVWYRYHHLFRDFLQTRLEKTRPELLTSLHRAASEWHAAHSSLREAVRHALQTRDWAYAAALVEQQGLVMMAHSEFSTVYEWCAAFPEDVIQLNPGLCIMQCWALTLGYRRQNRARIEERLLQIERAASAIEDKQMVQLLIGNAAAIRTFLATTAPNPAAAPQEHFALARKALEVLPEGDPARSAVMLTIGYAHLALHDAQAGTTALEEARQLAPKHAYLGVMVDDNYICLADAAFHQACIAQSLGQLGRAAEICHKSQAELLAMMTSTEQEIPAIGSLDIALGSVLLEQDRLEEAEKHLLHGLELVGWGLNTYYQMAAYVSLFRLREIQGRSAEAVEFLARLEEAWPDIAFCARGLRALHALRTAPDDPTTLAEAATWSDTFLSTIGEDVPPPGMGPFGVAEAYYLAYLAWARLQIALGNPQAARYYLERQLNLAASHGLIKRVIELSLLEAQAWRAQGNEKQTWAALERALVAAQPGGFLRIFDQGPVLTRLLVEGALHGISPEYIGRILAAIGKPGTQDTRHEGDMVLPATAGSSSKAFHLDTGEQLSERELEVLRLMARGASNQAIADLLVITVGTVKSHINHILGKLGVHNRTEAVARARELRMPDI